MPLDAAVDYTKEIELTQCLEPLECLSQRKELMMSTNWPTGMLAALNVLLVVAIQSASADVVLALTPAPPDLTVQAGNPGILNYTLMVEGTGISGPDIVNGKVPDPNLPFTAVPEKADEASNRARIKDERTAVTIDPQRTYELTVPLQTRDSSGLDKLDYDVYTGVHANASSKADPTHELSSADLGANIYAQGAGGGGYPPAPIPEPSTLVLLGIGTVSLVACAWKHRKRSAKRKEDIPSVIHA